MWIHDGDHNSSFFHNSVYIYNHYNNVPHISYLNGNFYSDRTGIEHDFAAYYSDLWSNSCNQSFTDVLQALPKDLPLISESDSSMLTREVSKNEIHQALLSLPFGRSPSPGGLNAEFYCFFWEDVSEHLFSAIKFFFKKYFLLKSWGKTYISLIPKRSNPKIVNDYHPISLCNVCYKTISKLVANRLQIVLPKLIGKE